MSGAIAAIPAILQVAGPVLGAVSSMFGSKQAGASESMAAGANAATYMQQAQIGYWQAEQARKLAFLESDRIRRQGEKLMGKQRAAYGKSGFAMTGTPLDVLAETAGENEYDQLLARFKGELSAYGYESEAGRSMSMANYYRGVGERRKSLYNIAGIGSVLTAVPDIFKAIKGSGIGDLFGSNSYGPQRYGSEAEGYE